MTSISLPVVSQEGGLAKYFRDIWAFPILEKDEELMLAYRWRDHGDTESAHKLVTSHLRLVAKMAMKYKGYGLPMADLVSEGNIGLMKAVKKFDPDKGFRLSTYAMWWIKASITEHILKSWSMVKIGTVASQKKLFFSLQKLKKNLKINSSGDLHPEQAAEIAAATNLSTDDVINVNRRLSARDYSLNAPMSHDEGTIEFQDTLEDAKPLPEENYADSEELSYRSELLQQALGSLSERERHIFIERRLKDNPQTLEALGESFGISRERVRQLEVRAFDKVKTAMMNEVRSGDES